MKKRVSIATLITSCLIVATITFVISFLVSEKMFNQVVYELSDREEQFKKLSEVDRYVRKEYINEIDEEKLNDSIVAGYLAGLGDKHSYYLTSLQYLDQQKIYSGSQAGIGIKASKEGGYIKIVETYKGSPSEEAGLLPGDLIIEINGQPITNDGLQGTIQYDLAVEQLSGEMGSDVEITYRRNNEDVQLKLIRAEVVIPSIMYKTIEKNTGYIRISSFNDSTAVEFEVAINDLINVQNVNGIIFDLRNNPGGTKESVINVLDRLIEKDLKLASFTSKGEEGETTNYAKTDESLSIPMVVLVNEETASAAELFAAVLRDYDKAEIVGSTTYGKGTIQTYKKLTDGSAIRLSTAYYKAPKSGSFDGIGIIPDATVETSKETNEYLKTTSFEQYIYIIDQVALKGMEVLNSTRSARGIAVEGDETISIDSVAEEMQETTETDDELDEEKIIPEDDEITSESDTASESTSESASSSD